NSLVGVVDSGFPILLADEGGRRLTPSAVYYPEDGAAAVVGEAALRMRGVAPGRVVTSIKRLIGRRVDEVGGDSPFQVVAGSDGAAAVSIGGVATSPEEVSSVILAHLKAVAENAMETVISKAVITVPAYFNDAQRQATKSAGEMAGLEVVRIVNEPTAAALAYGLDKLGEKSRVAVYDLGGGTFDISVLELNAGVFQVLATHGDTRLGGDDIDAALAEFLWSEAEIEGELIGADLALRGKFFQAAAAAKVALSSAEVAAIRLPFFDGENSFEYDLELVEFERIARPIVLRTKSLCRAVLADAGLAAEDLDEVVLAGGSTRTPLVARMVGEFFSKQPNVSQNPDEVVAMGAVVQAGVLSGVMRNVVLLDVTPLSLGIETFGGLMNVIIPRNTTIPAKRGELFTNAVANQESMAIRVLQGERELAKDNWRLGEIEVPFTRGAKGSARVGVQFEIDENGILEILTRDTATGEDRILQIESAAVDVEDERVEAMVSESVEHAFEDMNARLWTEAKLKSDELLPAVAQALEVAGDALDAAQREAVESGVAAVEVALESGEVRALKQANENLDRATEELAAILVERAMEGRS
ncbi:MAG: molecular chaperone DnaK, partial [Verrucomicrobiales bacterium]